jgi:hypothetical protein
MAQALQGQQALLQAQQPVAPPSNLSQQGQAHLALHQGVNINWTIPPILQQVAPVQPAANASITDKIAYQVALKEHTQPRLENILRTQAITTTTNPRSIQSAVRTLSFLNGHNLFTWNSEVVSGRITGCIGNLSSTIHPKLKTEIRTNFNAKHPGNIITEAQLDIAPDDHVNYVILGSIKASSTQDAITTWTHLTRDNTFDKTTKTINKHKATEDYLQACKFTEMCTRNALSQEDTKRTILKNYNDKQIEKEYKFLITDNAISAIELIDYLLEKSASQNLSFTPSHFYFRTDPQPASTHPLILQ